MWWNFSAIFRNAVARGCEKGVLVLCIARPDGSSRTLWRIRPTSEELVLADLEMLPAANAELNELDPAVLAPVALPNLWASAKQQITVTAAREYFNGDSMPHLAHGVLENALRQSVVQGNVCGRAGSYTYSKEQIPLEAITDGTEILPPPAPLSPDVLSATSLPEAWNDGQATLTALSLALGVARGYPLPWILLSEAVASGL